MFVEELGNYKEQMAVLGKLEWSVPRLIELSKDLDVMRIPLLHLNMYYSYDKMTLRQLAGQMRAVNNADLSFPIILDEDGEILDGRHRLIKAMLENKETIKAVRFIKNPEPCSSK